MHRLTSAGRWPRLLAGAVALVLVLSSCASARPAGAAGSALRYLGGELKTLDPAFINDAADVQLILQLYAGLTRLDEAGEPYPSLAESWTVSDDGRTYTFRLRSGLTFSDGSPLDATDVRRSWLRVLDPATGATAPDVLNVIEGAAARLAGGPEEGVAVQAPDPRTLEVRLRHPASHFPAIAATPTAFVVPRTADDGASWQTVDAFVGSGPYVVDRMDGLDAVFLANERYVAGPPPIEEIRWVTEIPGDSVTAYADEELDLVEVASFDATWIAYDADLGPALHPAASLSVSFLGFDTTRQPFDDPVVRRAFALALDRPRLVALAEGLDALPASSVVPPPLWPDRLEDDQATDPDEARRLLDEAGYADRADLGTITVNGGGLGVSPVVAIWQEELGVEIAVEGMDFLDYLTALEERPPQVFTINWIADYPSAYALYSLLLLPDATSNYGRWDDAEFVELLEVAAAAENGADQAAAYRAVDARVDEQAPVIPWAYGSSYWMVRPGLRGLGNMTVGLMDLGRVSWDG